MFIYSTEINMCTELKCVENQKHKIEERGIIMKMSNQELKKPFQKYIFYHIHISFLMSDERRI